MLQLLRKSPLKRLLLPGIGISMSFVGYSQLDHSIQKQIQISSSGIVRFLRTLRIGGTISLDYWLTNKLHPEYLSACHLRCSKRILDVCLKNGGVYVKLGQGLVALNHILPEEYLDTLEVLHDRALRVLPFEEIEKTFKDDFGSKPDELFKSFDRNCVAAASLAQVFKAETQDGQNVAVKVQYSDLRQRFTGDVWALEVLVSVVGWIHPNYNFRWVFDYLQESLVKELDFELEAENMRKCAHDLSDLCFVKVPKIVNSMTSKRILTMEWIDGIKINQKAKLEESGYSLYDIDKKLIKVSSRQIFCHGFLHADPHPGNILVVKNSAKPRDPFLCLLDHGLYETIDDKDRLNLCWLWKSIVFNDDKGMREHSKLLGVPEQNHRIFCEMLVQRPLLFRAKSGVPLAKGLTQFEMQYMKDMAAKRFDEIMACLKVLPRPMLLVFRNINTVRSIAKTHGHPVDRFAIMAREADLALFLDRFSAVSKQGHFLYNLGWHLHRAIYSNVIFVCQRFQIELFLAFAVLMDWFSRVTQGVICYFNKDVDHLLLEIEKKQTRRDRLLVE